MTKGSPDPYDPKNPRFPLLVSYAYLRGCDEDERDYLLNQARQDGFELLLDSGAFSVANTGHVISLAEYNAFLKRNSRAFFRYIALDVLGDPAATDRNLRVMLDEGLKPSPVHVSGDNGERMDELFELSDLVFFGGLKRALRGPCPKNYVVQKMRWAKGRNVHWLGYTQLPMVKALTPFSCDSSSWSSAQRYGKCSIYLGKGHWKRVGAKERTQRLSLQAAATVERFGYSMADWKNGDLWRGGYDPKAKRSNMAMDITAGSWIDYIMDVRARYGTRVFLACALARGELSLIRKHWARWRKR